MKRDDVRCDANRDRRMTSDLDSYQRQEIAMPDVRGCFITLEAAQLEQREKLYEYYRNKLLTFEFFYWLVALTSSINRIFYMIIA